MHVGTDALERVVVRENHDEAYHVWRDAGVRRRCLVHLDAHHDLSWMGEDGILNIGNFICAAMKDDMVREVVWVVPDTTWESRATRRTVYRHLRDLNRRYPQSRRVQVTSRQISTELLGNRLSVCPLWELAPPDEEVLLDIDVDYLLIPQVSYWRDDAHVDLPWCWPVELVDRLRDRRIRTDLVTIAYSVQGGYTPQPWKYLGDEIAERLRSPAGAGARTAGFASLREGATAALDGDPAGAERKYRAAADRLPGAAAPRFRLAHLCAELGRPADARDWYRQAVELDPLYRNPYNTAALLHHGRRRYHDEARELRRMLDLDPDDPYALFGLGRLAARRKQLREAEALFERSLASDDTHRALAGVLVKLGREDDAIRAYERSLKLALTGGIPLAGPVATNCERRLMDPAHWRVHARIARLHARRGATARAITGYRLSVAGKHDGVGVRTRLAWLYLRQHRWPAASLEAWGMLKQVPVALWDETRCVGRRIEGTLQRLAEPGGRPRYSPYSADRSPT